MEPPFGLKLSSIKPLRYRLSGKVLKYYLRPESTRKVFPYPA